MLCALLLLSMGASAPAHAYATQLASAQYAPAGLAATRSYAYAAYATTDSYDIMLGDGSGNDRRIARIKVDGIGFSDVSAQLSSDGSKIAFRVSGDRSGGSSLYVLDVKSAKSEQVASTKSTGESIGSYMWSSAGNTLAFVRSSPAPYPADVDAAYGSIFVYIAGQGTVRLGGSRGNERVAGFSSDGKGVYVSRREGLFDTTLESLVYLPISGGEGVPLIKSQLGLRYSQFAVWSEPGSPAKVAALAEGNFAQILAPALPPSSTPKPPTATHTALPPTATQPPPTETPTIAPTNTLEAEATTTGIALMPKREPTNEPTPGDSGPELPILGDTPTPTPISSEPSATEAVPAQVTPMASSASRVSVTGRLYGPSSLGIVVSDPAGTMPTLLRRDAEAYSYIEWTRDGKDLLVGGTRSGAAWGIGLDGSRHAVGVPLNGLHRAGWIGGSTVVLSDLPATRLVTLDVRSGSVVSSRGVGANPQAAAPALKFAVPYIHQVNDASGNANGNWACGPTSITMALAYYGRLEPWGIYAAWEQAEEGQQVQVPAINPNSTAGSDYAPYITNPYTAYGRTYTATAGDPSGNKLAGLYGTICPTGFASWQAMVSVLSSHGLSSQYVSVTWDGVVGALKRGHPVVLGNELTAAGHILLVIGYTPDGNLVVNDPYGNRFEPGYGGNNGRDVLYPWKRATARRALEVIGTYPPPPRPPRPPKPTRTPVPITTTATPITIFSFSTATPTPDLTAEPFTTVIIGINTPLPGFSTPDLPPTATPGEELPTLPIETPIADSTTEPTPEPTYEPTVLPEESPTPTFNVSNLVLQVPVLLVLIGFALVRRKRD